jgi:hypothetical protein
MQRLSENTDAVRLRAMASFEAFLAVVYFAAGPRNASSVTRSWKSVQVRMHGDSAQLNHRWIIGVHVRVLRVTKD